MADSSQKRNMDKTQSQPPTRMPSSESARTPGNKLEEMKGEIPNHQTLNAGGCM